MIGSPGQALSAFSASARKPSVRAGLAKIWARSLGPCIGIGQRIGVVDQFLGRIERHRGPERWRHSLVAISDSSQRRRNSPGHSIRVWRHSPRVNKFLCAPFRQSPPGRQLLRGRILASVPRLVQPNLEACRQRRFAGQSVSFTSISQFSVCGLPLGAIQFPG